VISVGHILYTYRLEATAGIVTGFWYSKQENAIVPFIMTNAATFKGFSGGPIVDVETGSVVGINRLSVFSFETIRGSRSSSAIGYYSETERNVAVPIDAIRAILPSMVEGNRITHATLGVRLHLMSLPRDRGVRSSLVTGAEIVKIDHNAWSPWGRKLRRGDVIVEISGERVTFGAGRPATDRPGHNRKGTSRVACIHVQKAVHTIYSLRALISTNIGYGFVRNIRTQKLTVGVERGDKKVDVIVVPIALTKF